MRGRAAPCQRLPRTLDVGSAGPGQPGNRGPADGRRNRLYRFEVAVGGDGEAGFDHVHAESVELMRHAQLLVDVHAAARRLLAVPQGRVEHRDPYSLHNPISS